MAAAEEEYPCSLWPSMHCCSYEVLHTFNDGDQEEECCIDVLEMKSDVTIAVGEPLSS